MKNRRKITLLTRRSPLAQWQANYVKQKLLTKYADMNCEILTHVTEGDRITDRALSDIGGKDLFVKDLQKWVVDGKADIAVHSLKDMSVQHHSGCHIAAFCKRDDPRDVFLSHRAKTFMDLPTNATVGTSSPRRQCQLKAMRPDIEIKLLRGNIGTRLSKLDHGDYDAIILAAAGLQRLGLESRITDYFDPHRMIPAIGQGIIAAECRTDDNEMQSLLQSLDDSFTRYCAIAERAVNQKIGGDCFTPIAAHATIKNNILQMNAMVGTPDGKKIIRATIQGSPNEAEALGLTLGEELLSKGAKTVINFNAE